MRIASSQFHATMGTALQDASSQVEDLMQKMASGQRMLRPSDDPINGVRLSRLKREDAALGQYRDNITALKSKLQQNESSMSGMVQTMLQARDLVVWASDGANSTSDLGAIANELGSLRDSLLYAANSKDQEGHYLFSGTAVTTQTVTYTSTAPVGSRYVATGNTNSQDVVVGNGVTQVANVSVPETATLLNQLDAAIAALQTPGATANQPAVAAALKANLDGLDTTLDSFNSKIATLGGAQNIIQTLDDNHANVSLALEQSALQLGQLDYAQASVELNGYTTAVQATQKAYGKVSGLSLFDSL
jgi:flagellar hook-associated protein 3 FlgL